VSDAVERVLNVHGSTVAVTYAGEAYLIAGYPTAFLISLLFGALAAAWTQVGQALRTNTGFVFYISGFYAVTLGMRSLEWISVAILPTIAVYVVARVLPRSRIWGSRRAANASQNIESCRRR
jgi:hypothetical protein